MQSILPLLLSVGLLLILRKKEPGNRLLSGAAVLCLVAVLGNLAKTLLITTDNAALRLPILIVHSLLILCLEAVIPLWLMNLMRFAGRKETAARFRPVFLAFLLVIALLLIVNGFTGFLFTVDEGSLLPVLGEWYFLLLVLMVIPVLLCLPLMWRISWVLALSTVVLMGIRYSLLASQSSLSVTALIMLLLLGLTFFSLRPHSILFEIGTHMSILSLLLLLLTISYITNSTISSNLISAYNEATMNTRDFNRALSSYAPLPWLLEFWEAHPDEIVNPKADDYLRFQTDTDNYPDYASVIEGLVEVFPKEFSDYGIDDVQRLSPVFRYAYARSVYEYVKYSISSIQQKTGISILSLIRPDGDGYRFVADGESGSTALRKPGDYIPGDWMREEWNNYARATARNGLKGGQVEYGTEDRFGFCQEIHYGSETDMLLCCHTIPGTFVKTAVDNIAGSRNRLTVIVVLLMVILLIMLSRTASTPLRKMSRALQGYIRDKDAEQVRSAMSTITSRDEIGYLAGEFTDLTHEIEVHIGEVSRLAGERERLNAELSLAANIQRSALSVDFPDCPQYSLYASMRPARVVGGDFYDFFPIDDDHLAMVIADVSGKGVPAALFMMSAKIMINDRAEAGGTPAEILTAVNRKLTSNNTSNMFVTVWLGILELSTGILTHTNAGHEDPMVRESDGHFHLRKDRHGMVIGGIDMARYRNLTLTLAPGDAIFVYTDGVPEANNPAEAFYGLTRLEEALNRTSPRATPKDILETVDRDVSAFVDGAEQFDDLTMLCLVYHGPQAAPADSPDEA